MSISYYDIIVLLRGLFLWIGCWYWKRVGSRQSAVGSMFEGKLAVGK
jgi:hypothetical protein